MYSVMTPFPLVAGIAKIPRRLLWTFDYILCAMCSETKQVKTENRRNISLIAEKASVPDARLLLLLILLFPTATIISVLDII
jgi:hypothetical protein